MTSQKRSEAYYDCIKTTATTIEEEEEESLTWN
jgi:hypothetical protein